MKNNRENIVAKWEQMRKEGKMHVDEATGNMVFSEKANDHAACTCDIEENCKGIE